MNSTQYSIERLDHLGIVAGVIQELKIAEFIDERLGTFEGETLSAGETVSGMIINGLGFSNKPLSLTPLFFQNCPLSLLFHDDVKAEDFNRFKLGRVLDRCYDYGTELLFSEVSLDVCRQENVDTTYNSLDTTSVTLSGNYLSKIDEEEVAIKLGHSKDHRPDLKQVMLEMIVCHDGGIPLIGKALDGNASDNTIFKERSEALIESFRASKTPRYLIADCKLYTEKNSINLNQLQFITRIPNVINMVGKIIDKALDRSNDWQVLNDQRKVQTFDVEHYGIKQRWHVLSSETSKYRAVKQVNKKVSKEAVLIEKQLFHLQAQRFNCSKDAISAIEILAKKWTFHQLKGSEAVEHCSYEGKGRPKKDQVPSTVTYQIIGQCEQDLDKIERATTKAAHYIIGSNIDPKELSDQQVIDAYKEQNQVERGFRFLKDPLFFTSSLFVKKPKRIMALLMVMLLSLLVYGIAERRMRACLKEQKETLPNQINQPTEKPTLRWVFQLLDGIHCLEITTEKSKQKMIEGLTPLREKILLLFGKNVANIYQISCS